MRGLLLATVIAALAAGGCATVRAKPKAPPVPVALEVPAPPPRVIVPPEPEIPEPPVPTPEPESVPPRTPRRPPVAGPAKTEPKADAVQLAPPTATLRQELSTSPADIVRRVREQLGQAQTDLRRVDYRALSADGKSQYDTATRFVAQAEQALREKNFVFAAKVAEKAAVLAASLVGRLRP